MVLKPGVAEPRTDFQRGGAMTFLQTAAAVRAAMGVDEDIPLAEVIRSMPEQMGLPIQDPAGPARGRHMLA